METLEQLKEKLKKANAIPIKGLYVQLAIHSLEQLIKDLEAKNKTT